MKWLSVIRRRKRFCNRPQFFIDRRASPRRPRTDYVAYLIRLHIFLFFFQNSAMGKLPSLQPLRGPCGRPAAWFVRKAIYECDPVCARSESLWRHFFHFLCFSLSQLFTFSRVHWLTFLFLTFSFVHFSLRHWLTFLFLTFSVVHFSLPHWLTFLFLTFSVVHFSLPHWLTFSLSRFRSYQQTVGSNLSVDFGAERTLKLLLESHSESLFKFDMLTNLTTSWRWLKI